MKIALFGATGTIGRSILDEALRRGHHVTAVLRDPDGLALSHPRLRAVQGDVADSRSVAQVVAGHDAVVSAVGPGQARPFVVLEAARSLVAALPQAGVARLVVVGGAGSLEVRPGLQLLETPEFPTSWRPVALAHRDALGVYRTAAGLDWTYVSPPALIEPGERTGRYRTGTDRLLVDAKGTSRISTQDYAVALLDELEEPRNVRRRMTVAY